MLIDYADQIMYLNKVRKGEIKEGYGLGIPEIDEYFRFKRSQLNLILGYSNVGKTTTALALMLAYSKRHGLKWLICSSENAAHSHIRKLVEFQCQKPIHKIEQELYSEAMSFVVNHFNFLSEDKLYTYQDIINETMSIRESFNFDGILLDPYNALIKDKELFGSLGGHEYDLQVLTELRMFCQKKDVSIWVIAHTATSAGRMKHPKGHEYEGHKIPPQAEDAEGGSKVVARSDDFLVAHRYTQHSQDWIYTDIHVRKVREIETGGRPTPMEAPIRLRSIVNNVGFEINGKPLILPTQLDQEKMPF